MKNIKGFSLIEVLVSVAILSVVMLGAYGVLITGQKIYFLDSTLLEMEQQTRNMIDRLVRESRAASSQVIVTNYNSTTNDKITVYSPTTPLGVQYYLSGTNLLRVYSGVTTNIASNVSLLKFTLSGSLLTINARADKTIYTTKTISFPLTVQVRLRNE